MRILRIVIVSPLQDEELKKTCTDMFKEPLSVNALIQAIYMDMGIDRVVAVKAIIDVDKLVELGWYIIRTETPTGIVSQAVTICAIDQENEVVYAATMSDFLAARFNPVVVPFSAVSNRLI